MRFASLASGSGGNSLVVEAGDTRILVDCGLAPREVERRLARLGLDVSALSGIVVTHEHDDHIGGVMQLVDRHDLEAWLTYGTWRAVEPDAEIPPGRVHVIDSHTPFAIGDIEVFPFPVPHDAREPVQYLFSDGDRRLGVLTDTGMSTRHIQSMLSGCDALVLECNHDPTMLATGRYPGWLKQRIGGPFGHLANEAAAEILAGIDTRALKHLIAAHLSAANNTPELARAALAGALDCGVDWIGVADQAAGFDWRDL